MDIKASIAETKREFEASFASGVFYDRQTQNSEHLEKIQEFINIRDGMNILDLGTGSGYLTFPIAGRNPGCTVTGLDIVSNTLEVNREKAAAERLENLSFVSYDGIDFPFESGTFDLIVTRYSLHHFPDIGQSIGEVSRVLKPGGMFFISDPCPNDCDTGRFVDDYMRMKKDGHIKFYTKDEWLSLCGQHGLKYADGFDSSLRFPRKKELSPGYEDILRRHDKAVIESYDFAETDTELYITERVNNILFVKEQT
jgi:ubiquinone/menaquinone biosynthesis C-methylase UbiE